MGAIALQITSLTIIYSNAYSDADQRKHRSSASLAFVNLKNSKDEHKIMKIWNDDKARATNYLIC